VRTEINVGEPLFQLWWAVKLLYAALRATKGRYTFELRGLKIEGAWLSFYIKPADGLELPKIMQWIKQTFSARFNALTGRSGHVWGERYSSEILFGEPPEGAKAVDWEKVEAEANTKIPSAITYGLTWDSPRPAGMGSETCFSPRFTFSSEPPPS
jgi:hypothetical protein